MPLIEGLGDEVTLVLGGFLLCVILMLAWFSTHTSEIPLLREMGVIVVELSQRRNRATEPAQSENRERASPEGQDDSVPDSSFGEGRSEEDVSVSDWSTDGVQTDTVRNSGTSVVPTGATPAEGTTIKSSSSSSEASCPSQQSNAGATNSAVSLPTAAEMVTAECERQHRDKDDIQGDNQFCNRSAEKMPQSTDGPVPVATAVVDESGRLEGSELLEHPSEEEIRRRRVQYFQTSSQSSIPLSDIIGDSPIAGQRMPASQTPSERADELVSSTPSQTSHLCDSMDAVKEPVTNSSRPIASSLSDGDDQIDRLPGDSRQLQGASVASSSSDCGDGGVSTSDPSPQTGFVNGTNEAPSNDSQSSRIRVKLKYMNETQRLVHASPMDTIGDFRRTHFQPELQENKWVRFIYNGQDLRDDARTLQACNISDNCTMHCLITAHTRPTAPRDMVGDEEGEDSVLGALMYPLFTLVLLIVWYFRFTYRQYFSAMSTVCLIGISFLLALSYISSLRSRDAGQQQQQRQQAATGGRQHPQQNHPHAD
ncbi:transmembrane and ubiquitin-like domain-containing protein 1 [Aplysia californica]|uniref:Transmembrane and ubiquitin-like domain-containing protein 1 n=1 Tax=Aplysia californica TaxID=6500 RepID=A0ABM0JHW8_APLCA|nr:transmembrane and ubiquitin-like domain-containing protein 1 [Aplysia californica]